ncbi:GIY-YIG nuclease family protein [Pseudidiomarina sp. CB1]|uniref:GIY-YIG nuclease family protein n=1 Tax=Pseudidiomarina sp. CB1 TaxID=2972484 RepID=UPI002163800A|nr:GIY-YIG nuclease family protein [Pseudidiomarina sp. CB1]
MASSLGWVYVLENASLPNLVKVGFTTRKVEERLREISQAGVPHPYTLAYAAYVERPAHVERTLHHYLNKHRYRKEWFRCSPTEVHSALHACGIAPIEEKAKNSDLKAKILGSNKHYQEQLYQQSVEVSSSISKLEKEKNEYLLERERLIKSIDNLKSLVAKAQEELSGLQLAKRKHSLGGSIFSSYAESRRREAVEYTLKTRIANATSILDKSRNEMLQALGRIEQIDNQIVKVNSQRENLKKRKGLIQEKQTAFSVRLERSNGNLKQ